MTDLLFVTEAEEEVTVFNYNYRYNKMTTKYMNKLTIDIEDNSEILGNIFMPNVFHFDHGKGMDWKQGTKDYSEKFGCKYFPDFVIAVKLTRYNFQ